MTADLHKRMGLYRFDAELGICGHKKELKMIA